MTSNLEPVMNVAMNMDSRRLYPVIAWWLALGICWAQVPEVTNEPTYHFGVTVVAPYGFCGWVYELPERQGIEELRVETVRPPFAPARTRPNCAVTLPQFQRLQPVGNIYTMKLNVQPRDFTEGFPGVTGRFEWFAIDYTARFWIETPGKYSFQLLSDDGSALYIDERRIINNDCVHR